MGCRCKSKKQDSSPSEAVIDLTKVNDVHPIELSDTPLDLTEEQKKQVEKIIQKIEDLS